MEKVRPWCGQPSDRGRLKIRSDQLRTCYQSIACCFTVAVARIPDARMPRNKGQWRRGRGNRCFCRRELITIDATESARRPAVQKTAASVCLYSVYRKQERSLFTAALEQTLNVPTAIIRPRPTAGLWSPIPSIRSAITFLCRAARLLFDRCATAPESRPLLAVSRAHPSRIQRRPTAVVLPQSRPPYPTPSRFGRATADYVDRPQTALGSRHWPGTAPAPAGDRPSPSHRPRPPAIPLRSRSTYSGEIDYWFLTFQTGSRFSGSRLTSLVVSVF